MSPARQRPKRSKSRADDRSRASGFPPKLSGWLDANRTSYELGRGGTGPRNARQLSKLLTALGEPISDTAVGLWRRAESQPDPRYIGHLERLMGAPWSYLDDPATPWPRPLTRQALVELLELFPDDAVLRLVAMLRAELAASPQRSTAR